ncbi:hypothetical protein [Aeromonas allosaccharophila]|uniref:hypothetical protein n=1 Tax=Aeromonas allosaccharophila TaxID=656 RepID=UPI001119D68B|nr:hypothetical protein [Aeromonas allosaccharophila]
MDMSPHFFLAARNRLPFSMTMTMTMTMTIDHRPSTIDHRKIRRGQGNKKRAALAALGLI